MQTDTHISFSQTSLERESLSILSCLASLLKEKKSYIISGSSVCRRNMSGRSKQMEWGMVDEVAATVPSILLWGEGISRDDDSSRKNRGDFIGLPV